MDLMRNVQSHFAKVPRANISRSALDQKHSYKSTGVFGKLIPVYCWEVLPGQTTVLDMTMVARLQPSVVPVADDAYIDTFFFYVPNRLVMEHWKEFIGDDTTDAWTTPAEYSIPQLSINSPILHNHLLAYLGVPIGKYGFSMSALAYRMYYLIWNEYFRDQNVMDPVSINFGDATLGVHGTTPGFNFDTYVNNAMAYGMVMPVSKYHDYFTSALPEPQKGPAVSLPIGGLAPIVAETLTTLNALGAPLQLSNSNLADSGGWVLGLNGGGNVGMLNDATFDASFSSASSITHSNLYADLENATGATINDFRYALRLQEFQELLARSGSRYVEILNSMFGVTVPDLTVHRPEYLGGNRMRLNMNQVVQTAPTGSSENLNDVLGNVAGLSLSSSSNHLFSKSFTEHGYVIGVMCARTRHSYSQGLNAKFSRKEKFDFYWPLFANIGEQPIKNKELYLTGSSSPLDDEIFGYQEAWASYRYKPSLVTGLFAPDANDSLSVWTYTDDYSSLPTLSAQFIAESSQNVERTLAVQDTAQFMFDILFDERIVVPMPKYSIPSILARF